jgi:molecular chaperone GrpE
VTDPNAVDGADGPLDRAGGGPPADAPVEPARDDAAPDEPPADDDVPLVDDEVILDDIAGLEASVEAERDDYLERLQRLQAEFENYRKRMTRQQSEAIERGAQGLAVELLPVLDGCEAALDQGRDDVGPIHSQLMELLGKAGLDRNGEPGDPFDPEMHEAVMHEPAGEGAEGQSEIAEVLRTGYSWKGRVLRPAMVKVRG